MEAKLRESDERLQSVLAALRESEQRLRVACSAARMIAWSWDRATNRLTHSENGADILGLPGIRFESVDAVFAYVHPADLPAHRAAIRSAITRGGFYVSEFRLIHPDTGSTIWIEDRGTVTRGVHGQLLGLSGVLIDISARRFAEEASRENERRFRQLADSMPQIVWASRPDGHVDYFNEQWYDFTGFPRGENGEQGWNRVLHPDDRERSLHRWREAVRSGEPYEIEYRFRDRRTDGYRWHLGRALPVRDESGRISRWFGTCTDIHDQKTAAEEHERALEREQTARAEAERANCVKDEFLATLSHELRTPLNAILGWGRMLSSGSLSESGVARALEIIDRNARLQTQLVEDILEVSRIVTGKLRVDMRPIDLIPVLEAAVDAVRPAADVKGVQLQTNLDASAGAVVGDPDRLQQVVWNLLSNAVKFTAADGRVMLMTHRIDSHVDIVVSDTGIGIAAEFIPHVFDRFRQADGGYSREFGGLGLGLAIARHLVERHGGGIRANSAGLGQGATFTVTLPLRLVHRQPLLEGLDFPPLGRHVHAVAGPRPDLSEMRVLIVDDEPDARELLTVVLARSGARVESATSVAEALDILDTGPFDLLISDIGLPEENGFELLRRVRERPPERGGRIPAVAVTAYARLEDRTRALRSGFQMHLAKPIDPAEFVAMVAALCHRDGLHT